MDAVTERDTNNAIWASRRHYVGLLETRERAPESARDFLTDRVNEAQAEYFEACDAGNVCRELDCWTTVEHGMAYCPQHGKR